MSGGNFSTIPIEVPHIKTKYRCIKTPIPVPQSLPILNTLEKYESRSMHGQLPVVWDRAEGFQVYDAWGNIWIDFTSTIFVANSGHGNPKILKALQDIIDKPLLHTYTYATQIRADYIKYLIKKTPSQFEKAFLLSAGTEATECALKLMRMNGWKQKKKKPVIIAFENNWHGRTMGAQMMSYNPAQKEWIGYLDPNIYHLPFPYPWRKEAINSPREFFRQSINSLMREHKISPKEDICGFMLETFQGWGAVFYPMEFVQELFAFARENNILTAFDEMQAGFGRTGKLFGYMHYGVEPDLICCGKGASSSLPLSIVLGSNEIMDLPETGSMSSTHSANPMVCAAGLANLKTLLEDGLIENASVNGEIFQNELERIKNKFSLHIQHVLGKGLVAAVHFLTPDRKALPQLCDIVCEQAMRKGLLLVHTGRESIKLAPPLCINKEALMEGLQVFEDVIESSIRQMGKNENN